MLESNWEVYNVYTDKKEKVLINNKKFEYYYRYNDSFVFVNKKSLAISEKDCGGIAMKKDKIVDINSEENKTRLLRLNGKTEIIDGLGRIDRIKYTYRIDTFTYATSYKIIRGT